MGNGEWETGNGEWETGNGERWSFEFFIFHFIQPPREFDDMLMVKRAKFGDVSEVALNKRVAVTRRTLHIAPFSSRLDEDVSILLHREFAVAANYLCA